MYLWLYGGNLDRPSASRLLRFEMPLNQLAQTLAVFVFHVDEFDAPTVRPQIADHGGEMHLAQPRANLQLNGIADAEPVRGFHICAAEANGLSRVSSDKPAVPRPRGG